MTKITFIGAGSTVFTKNIAGDILQRPALKGAEFRLMDINPHRLAESEIVVRKLAQAVGGCATVRTFRDQRAALDGTDFVIVAFQIGGYDPCTITDFEVPKKFGLRQTIADTLGIGGIMRGLRTVPHLWSICEDMTEVAPDAIMLQYVNPMAINTWAIVAKYPEIHQVGLCHSVQGTAKELAYDLDIPVGDIRYRSAGINHMAFFLDFEHRQPNGNYTDLYPALLKGYREGRFPKPSRSHPRCPNKVRYEMLTRLGYFVTESSEHFAEYTPWFIKRDRPDLIEKFGIPLDEYPKRCVEQIAKWAKQAETYRRVATIAVERSHEYASSIVNAVVTGEPAVIYGNFRNQGYIPQLPDGCAVEVPTLVDENGLQPTTVRDIPPQLIALMRTNINVQDLTVQALLTENVEHVYHAAMLDPHTAAELDLDQIWALTTDLLAAHGEWLPSFARVEGAEGRMMAKGWPEQVVIVGGGTAGWLAALVIGDSARRAGRPCAITVVESSKIGTIGVGEGTTAVFRMMLQHLGIDEIRFLRETDATIKYGIRHRDWRRLGHSYDGPIDDPHLVTGGDRSATYLDTYQIANGRPVSETHLFRYLMERGKSPFGHGGGRRLPLAPFHHAYHFDQAEVGKFLRRQAAGVTVIDDQVVSLERDPATGDILSLRLEGGEDVAGDFYVDCTGFRRKLILEMGAAWQSYADVLPVNRAMPFWIDLKAGEEIDPFTLAWAQGSGWLWKIPTARRYGCGYVYSDRHIDPDDAKTEIEAALGHPIEPRNDIRIDSGRLDRAWIGNCVALGLSSAFLEPLEATSIHGTVVQLMLLNELLRTAPLDARDRYNAAVARQVDDFRDFIRLHYVSKRRDTAFWRDVADSHPEQLRQRLTVWATRTPAAADFPPFPMGYPHVGHHLHMPVLDGLGLLNAAPARAELATNPQLRAHARKAAASLIREYRIAAGRAEGHRHFLDSLTKDIAA